MHASIYCLYTVFLQDIESNNIIFLFIEFIDIECNCAFNFGLKQAETMLLKGSLTRYFQLQVFSWISVPQAPKYSIGAFLNFFKNSQRYSQINVYHRCQRHRWTIYISPVSLILFRKKQKTQNFSLVSTTPPKICSPVSTTPLTNFSAVSATPAIRESCQC